MEREIQFRGKSLSTGEWVYGYYYAVPMTFNGSTEVSHAIVDSTGFIYTVDPKTVGQYIGYKDMNEKEIYAGDRVRILYTDWISKSQDDPRTLEQYKRDISRTGVIIFFKASYYINFNGDYGHIFPGTHGEIEVIDNPDLLTQ